MARDLTLSNNISGTKIYLNWRYCIPDAQIFQDIRKIKKENPFGRWITNSHFDRIKYDWMFCLLFKIKDYSQIPKPEKYKGKYVSGKSIILMEIQKKQEQIFLWTIKIWFQFPLDKAVRLFGDWSFLFFFHNLIFVLSKNVSKIIKKNCHVIVIRTLWNNSVGYFRVRARHKTRKKNYTIKFLKSSFQYLAVRSTISSMDHKT